MKLAYLLAQYLYSNKRLDLPGIGTFFLDPSVIIDNENSKHRQTTPEGIRFESNPAIHHVPELVNYISSKSGKMKALAEADLESHLQLIQQFLNISKPFLLEGIGTLVKMKQDEYDFTPGHIITDKSKDGFEKEKQGLSKKETVEEKYQAYLGTPAQKSRWRKPVITLLIISGIALAIWGGYLISTNRTDGIESTETANEATVPVTDSSQLNKQDTALASKTEMAPDHYKYVLEVARAGRAFRRYNQLKENLWDVKLETKDSVQYKLFLILPVTNDTTWKMDSLTVLSGKRVYIEHQN